MEENRTLKEVCTLLKVSRRAIQGYENAGLIKASGKNKYGHLLYDELTMKRIELIRLLQLLGLTIKEINQIIDTPNSVIKNAMESQVEKCKQELKLKEEIIQKAEKVIAQLD